MTFEAKDILTIGLSVLAVIISAVTAYFNVIRTSEVLSLIEDREPLPALRKGSLVISPHDRGQVSFANSGSRPVIIHSIVIFYLQPGQSERQSDARCADDIGTNMRTTFEPTIIKPNEILMKEYAISGPAQFYANSIKANKEADGAFSFPVAEYNKNNKDVVVDICLDIMYSTPTTKLESNIIYAFRAEATERGWFYNYQNEGSLRVAPTIILNHVGTIFN